MDGLLTAVKTVTKKNHGEENGDSDTISPNSTQLKQEEQASIEEQCNIKTPQDALRVLNSEPSDSQLLQVLSYLDPDKAYKTGYDTTALKPSSIPLLNKILSLAINERWTQIEKDHKSLSKPKRARSARAITLRCMTSISGIGALIANLRATLDQSPAQHSSETLGRQMVLRDTLSVLSIVLQTPDLLSNLHKKATEAPSTAMRYFAWSQLVSFLASGRALSISGETLGVIKDVGIPESLRWIGEGKEYASWLGKCIASMALNLEDTNMNGWADLSKFTQRALSLGYRNELLSEVYPYLLLQPDSQGKPFQMLVDQLDPASQKRILGSILHDLEEQYIPDDPSNPHPPLGNAETSQSIRGVSAVIALILKLLPLISDHLVSCLVKGMDGDIRGINMRRALIVVYAGQTDILIEILNKAIVSFGDKLYIKHTPQIVQQALCQVILLVAGYLYRSDPVGLENFTKSGTYLSAITHRIGASLPGSRFLGMVVGMSLSRLTDSAENAMKFQSEELKGENALWYMDLTKVSDRVGELADMTASTPLNTEKPKKLCLRPASSGKQTTSQPTSDKKETKILSIKEIPDQTEEDLLPTYAKPDSDASDSEEDPTLIQHSKPRAPVYIRDLVSALRDTNNAERYLLAISTAPDLIRRKAAFGTEIVENANNLALSLVSLQDKYSKSKFHENHLQSLVALIVALPSQMGRWMAHALFNVDLSLAHRTAILIALGLAARELAGFSQEDSASMGFKERLGLSFPSKKLPKHLEPVYGASKIPIENLSKQISQGILEPLALTAAENLTGPSTLKVQPLSTRAKEQRQKREAEFKRRQKLLPKDLHKTLSEAFLLPLLNEFGVMMYTMRSFGNTNPFLEPHLISLFTQTIMLLFSTLGPYAPSLNLFTSEILSLLITLHNLPISSDPIVLPAILSLFLTVLDLNILSGSTAELNLVTQFATPILELRAWVDGIFENTPKEEERVRTLAAGIMVKFEEATRRYKRRLLGLNSNFAYGLWV